MNKVGDADAYEIGWYVGQLMEKGLNVSPVLESGGYTDTVAWRVEAPDGRFLTVHLTIEPHPETS